MKSYSSTEKPKIYTLIGWPLKYSLSPSIHNYVFNNNEVNAFYYIQPTEADKLESTINAFKTLGYSGTNVTIPYKNQVIKYLDNVDKAATKLAAVNTIVNSNGILYGYNTDVLGFRHSLPLELNKDNTAVCLGAGGAAKAILYVLLEKGFKNIILFNRTKKRAMQVKDMFKHDYPNTNITIKGNDDLAPQDLNNKELIVNCTPMDFPFTLKSKGDILRNNKCVYDLRYHVDNNVFIEMALKNKTPFVIDGLKMLISQALHAQVLWGYKINIEQIESELLQWLSH